MILNYAAYPHDRHVPRSIDDDIDRLRHEVAAEYINSEAREERTALRTCLIEIDRNVIFFVRRDWDYVSRKAPPGAGPDMLEAVFCDRMLRRLIAYVETFDSGASAGRTNGFSVTPLEAFWTEASGIGTHRMRIFSRELLGCALRAIREHRPDALPEEVRTPPARVPEPA